jgi:hypothetical protein
MLVTFSVNSYKVAEFILMAQQPRRNAEFCGVMKDLCEYKLLSPTVESYALWVLGQN